MKSILISIRPKWCELIVSGEKTIEVRKTRPKLEAPFKCYIYCTKGSLLTRSWFNKDIYVAYNKNFQSALERAGNQTLSGKVIGEFVCDKIYEYNYHNSLTKYGGECGLPIGTYGSYLIFEDDYKAMCLSYDEVNQYGESKPFYGWHISNLVIYDDPKHLGEFFVKGECDPDYYKCHSCKYLQKGNSWADIEDDCNVYDLKQLERPPQSWCYVYDNNGG